MMLMAALLLGFETKVVNGIRIQNNDVLVECWRIP